MSAAAATGRSSKPAIAAVLSILLSGLGQLYNRQWIKGLVLAVIYVPLLFLARDIPAVLMSNPPPRVTAMDSWSMFLLSVVLPVGLLVWMVSIVDAKETAAGHGTSIFSPRKEVLLAALFLVLFDVAIVQIAGFPTRAKIFPLTIAIPMLLLAAYQVASNLRSPRPVPQAAEAAPEQLDPLSAGIGGGAAIPRGELYKALAWFASFFVLLWALGFLIAVPIFTAVYLFAVSREKWWWALAGGVLSWVFLYGLFVVLVPIPLLQGEVLRLLGLG